MILLPMLDTRTRQLIDLTRQSDKLRQRIASEKKNLFSLQGRLEKEEDGDDYQTYMLQHTRSYIAWLTMQHDELEKRIDCLLMQ